MSDLTEINGVIERITYHNSDNGFCVLRAKVKNCKDLVTVVSNALKINSGENFIALGNWINNPIHGRQFKANNLHLIQPTSKAGIEKYLGSGLIKGVGAGFAKRLVNKFGTDIFNILDKNPDRLLELDGIGEKRKEQLVVSWQARKQIHNIMLFLHEYGLGSSRAVRIFKTYGKNAIENIKQDPYCLARDIRGIGFKSADKLAQNFGLAQDSVERIKAGIRYILQEENSNGNCAVLHDDLISQTSELLNIDENLISVVIESEKKNQAIIADLFFEDRLGYFLPGIFIAENQVAKNLLKLSKSKNSLFNFAQIHLQAGLKNPKYSFLSAEQRSAVGLALESSVTIITGGPGVGKTTVLKTILELSSKFIADLRIMCAAPTGRAAKRMQESSGYPAQTLHRLLSLDPSNNKFKYNENNRLPVDLLILDEVSMVDIILMHHLLKSLPNNCKLVIVGDVDQLPSVGPGLVLRDIIDASENDINNIVVIKLTKIFRQAANSKIIVNAHRVNRGWMPEDLDHSAENKLSDFYFLRVREPEKILNKIVTLITSRIKINFNLDPKQDIQILAPMNKGILGVLNLNQVLKQALNPINSDTVKVNSFGVDYSVGDKVIQTVNNYDKSVFNGDIGMIENINPEDKIIQINFENKIINYDYNELDEINLAYAITIHKSQGSEYPCVIMPITTQHYTLLQRNLVYTGMTRGKQLVIIIGQPRALAIAVKNPGNSKRLTKLQARLKFNTENN